MEELKSTGTNSKTMLSQYHREQIRARHYFCPTCIFPGVVYHRMPDEIQTVCGWCNGELTYTGKYERIEGDDKVTYQDGKEVDRTQAPHVKYAKGTVRDSSAVNGESLSVGQSDNQ